MSVDDVEGREITAEVLGDEAAVGRIAESLRTLAAGEPGATVDDLRADLAARRG